MPMKSEYERCKKIIDIVEKSVLNFPIEINQLTKKEAEEIIRVLKQESKRSFFYECDIRTVINPLTLIEDYKLIVGRS